MQNLAIGEANRLKTEFVSMVSHEMRTPLTSIQSYVYLVLEGARGPLLEEQCKFLTIAHNNAGRRLGLIGDLLDLSRIEAGRVELNRVSVDLSEAVRGVADSLRPLLNAKAQTIALDLPGALPPVWADRDRATQILTNLISNAHKYTPNGGHIWVSARATDDEIVVDVRDDGVGLSDEDQAQLFTRFFRSKRATVQRTTGTGLGLAITHSLVSMHGGRMHVTSAPGQGSTFSFSLPIVPTEATAPAVPVPRSALPV